MEPEDVLIYFNIGLLLIAIFTETVNFGRDWQRKSRFAWFRFGRIGLLLAAIVIALYFQIYGLYPPFSPLRLMVTTLLIYIDIRGVYELIAR